MPFASVPPLSTTVLFLLALLIIRLGRGDLVGLRCPNLRVLSLTGPGVHIGDPCDFLVHCSQVAELSFANLRYPPLHPPIGPQRQQPQPILRNPRLLDALARSGLLHCTQLSLKHIQGSVPVETVIRLLHAAPSLTRVDLDQVTRHDFGAAAERQLHMVLRHRADQAVAAGWAESVLMLHRFEDE